MCTVMNCGDLEFSIDMIKYTSCILYMMYIKGMNGKISDWKEDKGE